GARPYRAARCVTARRSGAGAVAAPGGGLAKGRAPLSAQTRGWGAGRRRCDPSGPLSSRGRGRGRGMAGDQVTAKPRPHQRDDGRRRETRILNRGQSSLTGDIGAAVTLKEGALFLLTDRSGEIPAQTAPDQSRGLGLYFHDTRHLDEVTLRLNGAPPTLLLSTSEQGYTGVC